MRADDLDLGEIQRAREQVVRDVQRHLTGDEDVGVEEPVQGDVDGALGGVLDGHHAVAGSSPLHLIEDVGDAPHRHELGR